LRKGREGEGRNVEFHHLLLSNLTTAEMTFHEGLVMQQPCSSLPN